MVGDFCVILLVANTRSYFLASRQSSVYFAIFCLPENTLDVSYYLHFVFDPHQCRRLAIDAVYAAAGIDVSECDVCCKKVLRVSDVKTFQFNINICCTC